MESMVSSLILFGILDKLAVFCLQRPLAIVYWGILSVGVENGLKRVNGLLVFGISAQMAFKAAVSFFIQAFWVLPPTFRSSRFDIHNGHPKARRKNRSYLWLIHQSKRKLSCSPAMRQKKKQRILGKQIQPKQWIHMTSWTFFYTYIFACSQSSQPIDESIINHCINLSINSSSNQTITTKQFFNKSINRNQSINQSFNLSVHQLIDQPAIQSANQFVPHSINLVFTGWTWSFMRL